MYVFSVCYTAEADTMFGYGMDGNADVRQTEAQAAHHVTYSDRA